MSGWTGFLALAPERVREVIESGPMTYGEYGSGKLSVRDKQMGLMRFKGGTGRGAIPMKSGQRAVVYFDPDFVSSEYQVSDVPDTILDKHSKSNVIASFKEM
jgi:hypothetical protein